MSDSNVLTAQFNFSPKNLKEALEFADVLAKSSMVPKSYQNKPADILVAVGFGQEIGLKPLQALQNIASINGRPAVWGDASLALVKAHPSFEYLKETWDESTKTAKCVGKRKNEPNESVHYFSMADAQRITQISWEGNSKKETKLADKDTYKNYGPRMCQMRARAFVLRDLWPDVLKGLAIAEEAQDISEVRDVTPKQGPTMPTRASELPAPAPAAEAPKPEPANPQPPAPPTDALVTFEAVDLEACALTGKKDANKGKIISATLMFDGNVLKTDSPGIADLLVLGKAEKRKVDIVAKNGKIQEVLLSDSVTENAADTATAS